MTSEARWPIYWAFLLLVLLAFVLVLIDRAARTGLLGWAALALLGLLFVFALLWVLVKERWRLLFRVLCVLGALVVAVIVAFLMACLMETNRLAGMAVGFGLIGLFAMPGILWLLAVVLCLGSYQLPTMVGGKKGYYRGLVHARKSRHEEALAAFTRYQHEHPEDPRGRELLALSLLSARRYEEALEEADTALQLQRRPERLLNRGQILLALGAVDEALSDIEAALRLKPDLLLGRTLRALGLVRLRRLDDALGVLKRESVWRKASLSLLALGDAYRLRRMSDLAFKAYEKAAAWAAGDVTLSLSAAKGVMAYALAQQAKLEQAEEAVRWSLARDSSDIIALYAQALIQRQRGDYDGVKDTLQRMLTLNPDKVVTALTDPDFTPLLVEERFRRLLSRALEERERILERVRNRALGNS